MNQKILLRIAAMLAAPLVMMGIVVKSQAVDPVNSHDLADYGASVTAQIAQEHARDAGVRHDSDVQHSR